MIIIYNIISINKINHLVVSVVFLQLTLHTKDGVKLGLVAEMKSWVWCAKVRPETNAVVSSQTITRFLFY